jgi:hypothetical protein
MQVEARVHIWPHIEGEADRPKSGWFAVKLGRGHTERALLVVHSDGYWFVYLDGRLLAAKSDDWKQAFGRLYIDRNTLAGRWLTKEEYEALCRQREEDATAGIDLSRPINLSRARAPF